MNELIERLTARLSPEGREVQEELEVLTGTLDANADVGARIDEALAHMGRLSEEDQGLLSQIAQLRSQAYGRRVEEYREGEHAAQLGIVALERAHELERAAGRDPDPDMTLAEALAILERHGVGGPDPETSHVVNVPREEERTVPAFYPDFANPDNWRRWDGSEQAEAWERLMDFRDECIARSVGELAGTGFEGRDDVGLVAALWGIGEDEAAEIVARRRGF